MECYPAGPVSQKVSGTREECTLDHLPKVPGTYLLARPYYAMPCHSGGKELVVFSQRADSFGT